MPEHQDEQLVTGPIGRLFGVVDDPTATDDIVAALGEEGIDASTVEVLEGAEAANSLDASGEEHGPLSRLWRALQFSLADQIAGLAYYEAALRDGRAVLSIGVEERPDILRAVAVLSAHGAHYVNHYGRFQTEEFSRWRGPEPDVQPIYRH
jgi:hypothetical protein